MNKASFSDKKYIYFVYGVFQTYNFSFIIHKTFFLMKLLNSFQNKMLLRRAITILSITFIYFFKSVKSITFTQKHDPLSNN